MCESKSNNLTYFATLILCVNSIGLAFSEPLYTTNNRSLTFKNALGTDTIVFENNENVTVEFIDKTPSKKYNKVQFTVKNHNETITFINKQTMSKKTNVDDSVTFTYTFNTASNLGDADWYYYTFEANSPKANIQGNFAVKGVVTNHSIKTFSDPSYTIETDKFSISDIIYVEIIGDNNVKKEDEEHDDDDDNDKEKDKKGGKDDDKDHDDKKGKSSKGKDDSEDDEEESDDEKHEKDDDKDSEKDDDEELNGNITLKKVRISNINSKKYINANIGNITQIDNVYRFTVDLSDANPSFDTTGAWYSLDVKIKQSGGGSYSFIGYSQLEISSKTIKTNKTWLQLEWREVK